MYSRLCIIILCIRIYYYYIIYIFVYIMYSYAFVYSMYSYVFKVTPRISIFTVKNAPRRLDTVLKNYDIFIKFRRFISLNG